MGKVWLVLSGVMTVALVPTTLDVRSMARGLVHSPGPRSLEWIPGAVYGCIHGARNPLPPPRQCMGGTRTHRRKRDFVKCRATAGGEGEGMLRHSA